MIIQNRFENVFNVGNNDGMYFGGRRVEVSPSRMPLARDETSSPANIRTEISFDSYFKLFYSLFLFFFSFSVRREREKRRVREVSQKWMGKDRKSLFLLQ